MDRHTLAGQAAILALGVIRSLSVLGLYPRHGMVICLSSEGRLTVIGWTLFRVDAEG